MIDNEKELIEKARRPMAESARLHAFYRGKIETSLKCRIRDFDDFALWYSPGVAQPCLDICGNKELVYKYTNKWNTIAVISDGTRVLGLGDIGPEAAMPVMEGKALLYKYLGGVDAVAVCLDTKDPDEFVRTVKILQPSFGGINLEDIASPKCFDILERLRNECHIPVWHDDQQGTAAVVLAALINALRVVDKGMSAVNIAMVGAGASNIRIAHLIILAGADPGNIIMCDSRGILNKQRSDLRETNREKWDMCTSTNSRNISGNIADMVKGADVLIALSKPGPGVIKKEWIAEMAEDAVVFACANPVPEIWPWEAKEAGARIVATGRSDFPNQVNNSLVFPAIFRGALDVMASRITDTMCIAAAYELADYARKKGLSEEYIIPAMDETDVFISEAVAVGMKAIEEGLARQKMTRDELFARAGSIINRSREQTRLMMDNGIIKDESDTGV
ncbi:MAG: NADP-dependent malic enzyme [Elusimicrobiota bacterium]